MLDCDAERLTLERSTARIKDADPRLVVFAVCGQNPNSGTYLTSAPVRQFRDETWQKDFSTPACRLALVESKFGIEQRKNVEDMASIRLKRALLGD